MFLREQSLYRKNSLLGFSFHSQLFIGNQWSTSLWRYSGTTGSTCESVIHPSLFTAEPCPDIWKTAGKVKLQTPLWWTKCNNVLPGVPFQMKNVNSPGIFPLWLGFLAFKHPQSSSLVQMVVFKHYDWVSFKVKIWVDESIISSFYWKFDAKKLVNVVKSPLFYVRMSQNDLLMWCVFASWFLKMFSNFEIF